jgi:hypothetical protein
LAPGEWIFGSNAIETPGLDELADLQLRFDASEQPGPFLALDVTSAELRGDTIVGTVTNNGSVDLGDFNVVNVACFSESQPTGFTAASLAVPVLRSGESAEFTTAPVDPTSCTSFAVYAVGVAQADLGDSQPPASSLPVADDNDSFGQRIGQRGSPDPAGRNRLDLSGLPHPVDGPTRRLGPLL